MAKIYSRKGSANWWASYPNPSGGQTIRKSTGIPAQAGLTEKAQLRANEMELEAWSTWRPGEKQEDYSYDEVMATFIEDVKPGRGHVDNIKVLTKYFTCKMMSAMKGRNGVAEIGGYKKFRAKVSSGTLRRELSVFSSAINHCIREYGWTIDNPVTGRLPPKSKPKLRWLRPEEARALYVNANPGLRRFILLGLSTGMRKSEITSLTESRCDLEHAAFHFAPNEQKNRRHDTLPMSKVAMLTVRHLLRAKGDDHKGDFELFPWASPRKAFKNACGRAGLEGVTIHTLRHTFASWMVQRGVPLREVQELMRHASISETEKYAHLAPRSEVQYLHSVAYRPGQGLQIIDNIIANQVLKRPKMVGTAGFEPATPTPPVWCATRLRYAPIEGAASYPKNLFE